LSNLLLTLLELVALVATALALHRLRPRFGLAPVFAFLSGVAVLAQVANYSYPLAGGAVTVNGAVLLLGVVFMTVLIVYAADGTVAAAQALAAVVGLSLIVFLAGLFNKMRLEWLGPGAIAPIVPGQSILVLNPLLILGSIVAMFSALNVSLLVFRQMRGLDRPLRSAAPGVALVAAFWTDALLFNTFLALGADFETDLLGETVLRDLLNKTVLSLLLWPAVGVYLSRVLRAQGGAARNEWSLFDVLFGAMGRMESDLSLARGALRKERDVLRRLAEASPVGILRFDREGRVDFANGQAEKILGVRAAEIRRWTDSSAFWGRRDRDASRQERTPFGIARATGRPLHGVRMSLDRPDDTHAVVSVNVEPLRAPGGAFDGVLATLDDVTEQRRSELEREALIRELEQKNEELEQFAYTVSHDLRSPLITMRVFLGHLARAARRGDLESFDSDLARVMDASGKMDRMLAELLDLSRSGRRMSEAEPVPLGELVRDVLAVLAGPLQERAVEIVVAPDLPTVLGDRRRLLEVVQNLVENAVKFMGDQESPRLEIGWRSGTEPALFVRDNGIGISARYQERVFGLFDKLDTDSAGAGVGLALVKRIVEVHGGRVWVESEGAGTGATFWVQLPFSP